VAYNIHNHHHQQQHQQPVLRGLSVARWIVLLPGPGSRLALRSSTPEVSWTSVRRACSRARRRASSTRAHWWKRWSPVVIRLTTPPSWSKCPAPPTTPARPPTPPTTTTSWNKDSCWDNRRQVPTELDWTSTQHRNPRPPTLNDVTLTFRNHAVTHAPLSNGVTIWQRMLKRVVNTSNVSGNSVG